ncbi:sister chromatid cohesion protein-like protein Dcc1 [Polyplosphaeria fusca]|uniref:Sister chromatid cohesion protein-like protein Dcc1 n=1 Tax=Polyplosphaeria fusca TaxID=682080 RepID=A0A9P4R181_9PLEO|nr:sister chromatid cohesion protein-like protein Dcc1 [Polyplosphaeria fusca]
MATQQDAGGVPFSIAHDMRQFRLLELPAELLALLDAPDPPLLSMKSQAPSSAKPAYVVLCTPTSTFQLRQVQTSNTVLITQPTLEAHDSDIPVPTTRAMATCTTTLELHPADGTPIESLTELLPLYHIVDDEVDASGNGKSKDGVFRDIPFSDGQCNRVWQDMMAFEFAGSCWRPSANTLIQVWRSINQAAVADGIKLDKQFLTEDLMRAVDEDAHPADLVLAILMRLNTETESNNGPWSCLDCTKTVSFVGTALLDAKIGLSDYATTDFIESWKDCLPEVWRNETNLKAIDAAYSLPSPSTIRSKKSLDTAKADAAPKAGSQRKWHEKFGRARKK